MHEPAPLIVLACLSVVVRTDFLYVMRETSLTQRNLSSHLPKLQAPRYVAVQNTFLHNIPLTLLQLTYQTRDTLPPTVTASCAC